MVFASCSSTERRLGLIAGDCRAVCRPAYPSGRTRPDAYIAAQYRSDLPAVTLKRDGPGVELYKRMKDVISETSPARWDGIATATISPSLAELRQPKENRWNANPCVSLRCGKRTALRVYRSTAGTSSPLQARRSPWRRVRCLTKGRAATPQWWNVCQIVCTSNRTIRGLRQYPSAPKIHKDHSLTLNKKLIAVLTLVAVLLSFSYTEPNVLAQTADSTPPRFESAEVDATGRILTITFTEDIVVSPFVQTVSANSGGYAHHFFIRGVIEATVDGRPDLFEDFAEISGDTLKLRLTSPSVSAGQEVQVSYNNHLAVNADGLLQDASGNRVPFFSSQSVQNNSTVNTTSTVPDGPLFSVSALNLDEGSTGNTFDVTLPSQPSGTQKVQLFLAPPGIGTLSHAQLTFDQDNWNRATDRDDGSWGGRRCIRRVGRCPRPHRGGHYCQPSTTEDVSNDCP